MPIRFRCAYCNQLMGIARRKAGTVVRCPTCSGQVVVPNPDEGAGAPGPQSPAPLFERSDFDELFEVPVAKDRPGATVPAGGAPAVPAPAPAAAPAPAGAWGTHGEPAFDVDRLGPGAVAPGIPAPGIVLTPGHLTMLTVAGILLLAVVFGAGVLVGRFVLGS